MDNSRARRVRQEFSGPGSGRFPPRQEGRRGKDATGLGVGGYRPIDIFGAKPLGIFTKIETEGTAQEGPPVSYLKTWDTLLKKDLKLAVTHPPANGFEEMIQWTEQGKLWHFPINNEQSEYFLINLKILQPRNCLNEILLGQSSILFN